MKSIIKITLTILFLMISSIAFALDENEKLWLGLNMLRPLTEDKKWLYLVFSQFRFIDESHPLQLYLIEGGVGHQLLPQASVWFGYRWSAHRPYNDFYQTNRLWQQLLIDVRQTDTIRMQSRLRIEEIDHSHESQPSFRSRVRLYNEWKHLYFGVINPLVYEEVFFQLNKTNYTTHQFVSENRLFIGVNWRRDAKSFWEIGYINQYEWATPQNTQNTMSHVLSLNYNLM